MVSVIWEGFLQVWEGHWGKYGRGTRDILPALALTPSRVWPLPPYSEFCIPQVDCPPVSHQTLTCHKICVSNCAWNTLSSLRAANMHQVSHQQLQAMRKRRLFKRRLPLERPASLLLIQPSHLTSPQLTPHLSSPHPTIPQFFSFSC